MICVTNNRIIEYSCKHSNESVTETTLFTYQNK